MLEAPNQESENKDGRGAGNWRAVEQVATLEGQGSNRPFESEMEGWGGRTLERIEHKSDTFGEPR